VAVPTQESTHLYMPSIGLDFASVFFFKNVNLLMSVIICNNIVALLQLLKIILKYQNANRKSMHITMSLTLKQVKRLLK
jgi:hypothetical protein